MTDVTVTGGNSHPRIDLGFVQADAAYYNAKALASAIDSAFSNSTAVIFNGGAGSPPVGTGNYLIATSGAIGSQIVARGYGAITVDNVVPPGSAPGTTLPVAPNAMPDVSIVGGSSGAAVRTRRFSRATAA